MNDIRGFLSSIPGIEIITSVFDIAIVFFLVYRMLLLMRGTRAAQMLVGIVFVLLLFLVSKEEAFNLTTLNWVLDKFFTYIILILIVLFQPDIRRALSQMGKNPLFFTTGKGDRATMYDEIIEAVRRLAEKKIGAIIAIERQGDLETFTEEAAEIDARVRADTLCAIFVPSSDNPLHDGAVIIRKGRISHAGCVLPLTENQQVDKTLGTRHRAAIGLTEITDAVAVVVSEQTGTISLSVNGELERGLDVNSLRQRFRDLFGPKRRTFKEEADVNGG